MTDEHKALVAWIQATAEEWRSVLPSTASRCDEAAAAIESLSERAEKATSDVAELRSFFEPFHKTAWETHQENTKLKAQLAKAREALCELRGKLRAF